MSINVVSDMDHFVSDCDMCDKIHTFSLGPWSWTNHHKNFRFYRKWTVLTRVKMGLHYFGYFYVKKKNICDPIEYKLGTKDWNEFWVFLFFWHGTSRSWHDQEIFAIRKIRYRLGTNDLYAFWVFFLTWSFLFRDNFHFDIRIVSLYIFSDLIHFYICLSINSNVYLIYKKN